MMETRFVCQTTVILCTWLFLSLVPKVAIAKGEVDPQLVGTWKLNYPGPPTFWVVRADGVYRIHGPQTAAHSHRGEFQAAKGKWSLNSPKWQDGGTYELKDENTWVAIGKLGAGTWSRVWKPGDPQSGPPAPTPACELLTLDEVARVLEAPVSKAKRQGGPDEGCKFKSALNDYERLTLWMTHGSTITDTFQRERKGAKSAIDVPGVGRAAYATISRNGILLIHVLGNEGFDKSRHANMGTLFKLSLKVLPKATQAEIPLLANLAKRAFERWGGKKPLRVNPRKKSSSAPKGFSLGSLLGAGTPLPPGDKGACLVSADEIENAIGVPFEDGKSYGSPQLQGSVKKAICKYRQRQGHGGEIAIAFHSRSSTRQTWMRRKGKPEFYDYQYVPGIGDDAYWHFVESGSLLRVSALYGNGQLNIEWKGNERWGTGPTEDQKEPMLSLLKVAGKRLQ